MHAQNCSERRKLYVHITEHIELFSAGKFDIVKYHCLWTLISDQSHTCGWLQKPQLRALGRSARRSVCTCNARILGRRGASITESEGRARLYSILVYREFLKAPAALVQRGCILRESGANERTARNEIQPSAWYLAAIVAGNARKRRNYGDRFE